MSATFVFPQANGVHMLSDGAITDLNVIEAIGSKVATFPEFNLAVAYQGMCNPHWIWDAMAAAGPSGAREAVAHLPAILLSIAARNRSEGREEPDVRFIVAAWAPEIGGAAWMAYSRTEGMPQDYRPGSLVRVRAYLDAVADPAAVLGREADFNNAASFDPVTDGMVLMEAARRTPFDDRPPEGRSCYHVGGFAEIVTVGPDGLLRRTLKEWPEDVAGKRIRPKGSRRGLWDWKLLDARRHAVRHG